LSPRTQEPAFCLLHFLLMADLIAQGSEFSQRWRRSLPSNQTIVVGRQSGPWSTPWDEHISRQHVRLEWNGKRLLVEKLPTSRNPVFLRGNDEATFQLMPGEHFVIGNTTFTLSSERLQVTLDAPRPEREQTFSTADLQRVAFRNANQRIELLSRLPEVIKNASTDNELFVRLVNLLLSGVPQADAAALVAVEPNGAVSKPNILEPPAEPIASSVQTRILHWDRRRLAGANFQPSQRLIQQSLAKGETVLHTWTGPQSKEFTETDSIDWAYCTPLPGDACRGWALYVAGRFGYSAPADSGLSEAAELRDDIKFTEMTAATLSSLRELNRLGRQQAGLSQFFAPVVMEALATGDPQQVLAPRETEVAVLFCDLRGFSRTSERSGSDLLGLLERVSKALGVMTHQILDSRGVVGDFQGDAAMGFWGWPLAEPDAPLRAAQAALAIRAQFEAAATQPEHPLADFRVGIGIAMGRAVAGKIGTADHVKVTVFGPVVNLAARLESMTKFVNASILLDPAIAATLRRGLPRALGRIRRVAVVRPYGLTSAVEVSELLSPAGENSELTDENLAVYEAALAAFTDGRWLEAREQLDHVPAADRVKSFLANYLTHHRHTPPTNWDGVVVLESK
jgi:adenylate cyclase